MRYEKEQLISQQIEQALARRELALPERFEIGSHLALMSMVANGVGWAITTPLGYMRAHKFRDDVQAFAWPYEPFDRKISVFASEEWADAVPRSVARTMRGLIQRHMIDPALADMPFLASEFRILDA